jgi:hypothetical protein
MAGDVPNIHEAMESVRKQTANAFIGALDRWLDIHHGPHVCDGECLTTRAVFVQEAKNVLREALGLPKEPVSIESGQAWPLSEWKPAEIATSGEAIKLVIELQRISTRITHAANSSRGVGPGLIRQERKAVRDVLQAILLREPTPKEIDAAIFK